MITDLTDVKRQCRADDYDYDDNLLSSLCEAAEEEVVRITGRTLEELVEMGGGRFPAPIRQAILTRTAQFYRDAEGTDKPNALFISLIRPYQII
ncbi:MAG: head-tail connector protein [Candidatus Amulumruptor caecigallinarius]|nr:head-tail connector protein [Candidatus Amulumruptor caecigallinarius]